ncbi:YbhB/YbcL family Raf kinase inhibitor-like protein [Cytophaga hutchinsonii]|jgi:Raf kinase inhibitor-like YbhB/YbcL family protein|uniref:Phospholipid-binding protein, PBP family n=1 Tax=Cytophaga hutchinsonii (strain ATCC 33406 / DSM 1761 / CIP 103989 / NBRC 15051 / NCIMB 9469 / D465) TaxID=269798 RepID=A0A6N4SV52_CYTH3|nr:YbhB/YbcL family Raf kinase inhibitor-like protein [Cytophaga hutchinsonii]ABG60289.1 conserved hypothetical protein [Cytophaga hutchinsonii ATCC 33406]SFX19845.1 hypothetical protein SAMN04487930_1029 [Cytophaga hutchinsonii ATCC 33406]
MKKKIWISVVVLFILALIIKPVMTAAQQKKEFKYHNNLLKTITLTSTDFIADGKIPVECTGDGEELSPALQWTNIPKGTKSFVLLMTDYDAPAPFFKISTVDHWVIYNIPAEHTALSKGLTSGQLQESNISSGQNFKKGIEYKGPKPPLGVHNYYFRVYALSVSALNLKNPTKQEVMNAMKGKVLAYGELIGKY